MKEHVKKPTTPKFQLSVSDFWAAMKETMKGSSGSDDTFFITSM